VKLEETVGRLLRERRLTVAVAESCTGGLIGDRLTDVPGSSDYFRGSVVAYSNEVKQRVLGVRDTTLKSSGAVSARTVTEMACGVRRLLRAELGIAVSGIAGPAGATRTKPVGLVFVGVCLGTLAAVESRQFVGDRRTIKRLAATAALDLCLRLLGERV
jgi:nicotinamide-nucleotide amidase